jgi:23S rRNA pseudouridine1911/1915/1917 synthase
MTTRQWRIAPADAGLRLDVFLARQVPDASRSAVARWVRVGAVRVTGRAAKPGLLLRAGDEVVCVPPAPVPARAQAEDLPIRIRFEDEHLAIVDKPAGMVTHPSPGHPGRTLVNALLHHLRSLSGIGGELRPGIVHRLDRDTSGLLLVAKHDAVHRALAEAIRARTVRRSYDAVVWGAPVRDRFSVAAALGRDPRHRRRFAVVPRGGKPAATHGEVLRRFHEFTLLRLSLETGRTHQIRLHCRHLDLPVVGDRTYGRAGEARRLLQLGLPRPGRQLLHARRLELIHPVTGQALACESPWPEDFAGFVAAVEAHEHGGAQAPAKAQAKAERGDRFPDPR